MLLYLCEDVRCVSMQNYVYLKNTIFLIVILLLSNLDRYLLLYDPTHLNMGSCMTKLNIY